MRMPKIILFTFFILAGSVSCGKDSPTAPKDSPIAPAETISDYVKLSVSGGEPAFSFPSETSSSYSSTYSNIHYNLLGQVSDYDLQIKFGNNTYLILVDGIGRNSSGATTSYIATINATINGKEYSGYLSYP